MNAQTQEISHETQALTGIRVYVDDLIAAGISAGRIALEAGIPYNRFKSWLDGKNEPGIIPALTEWKADADTAGNLDNGFVLTPTAAKIVRAFDRARQAKGGSYSSKRGEVQQRGIALIYGASGAGKTETAEWYQRKQNAQRDLGAWPVVFVRCTGEERSLARIQRMVIDSMQADGFFYTQSRESKLEDISAHIPPGGLLIFDEAQLLPVRRMDELRIFPDHYGIAVAFMGNMAGYKELVDAKIGQITSRVGGSLVIIDRPAEGDVDALLDAWEIRGRKVRELALLIGLQDGGLRALSDTASAVRTFSKAVGQPIDADLFKAAAVSAGAWNSEL